MIFCFIFQKKDHINSNNKAISVACSNAQITTAESIQQPDNRISLLREDNNN